MKRSTRKTLPSALVLALGAGVAVSIGTDAVAQQAQRVEKIEVTGTQIKRVDTETVAPVEIITREQLERTGQPTVAEVLRNIPANTGGSFNESFANSFAPGASGISLRGLGQKATLVLINGRRTAGYGFAQNIQDTFVDLNSIPTSAVERIEVLKDGASAIYGSDAIAGVVNIILRKDYRGAEVTGSAGYFNGKNDYRFTATGGFGDLARDRYSVFGTFDYYKRDLVELRDTEFGASRDMRGQQGGRNHQSLTGGGTWRQLSPTNALTNVQRAISDCAAAGGFVVDNTQAVALGLIAAPLGNAGFNLAGNTFCARDFNDQFTILPKTERFGFMGRLNYEFSPNLLGYVDLGLSRVESFQTFQSTFFAGTTALRVTPVGLSPFPFNINFAPGVAGNPFPTNARYQGVFNDLGTRNTEINSDTLRLLAGLNYTFGRWDFDSAIGWSRNEIDAPSFNLATKPGVGAVFNVPTTPQPPIPLSTSSTYNLDRFTTNSDAVRNQLITDMSREATSELKFIDTRANTEFGRLPGGPVGVALGAEFRNEKLQDRPDSLLTEGNILGRGATATDGKRDHYAVFGELAIPITRTLEGQLAGRYDHYSDYGSSSTPKVGLKFKPTSQLLLRANWGKGFRAPTLVEISPSVATFFTTVNDPVLNLGYQVSGVFAGNKDLEPEKSESSTLGVIFEPTANASVGVNVYKIKWKNIVVGNCCQQIVNSGDPTRVIRNPEDNRIVVVLGGYENIGETETQGVDIEGRYRMSSPYGRWTFRANGTYVDSYEEDGVEYAGTNGAIAATIPRFRANAAVDWDWQALSATLQYNYIRGIHQQLLVSSWFTEQDRRFQNGVFPEQMPSYTTWDLYLSYQLTKNLKISGAVINIYDKKPPYDPGFSATNLFDFSIFDVRGVRYRLGLTWKM